MRFHAHSTLAADSNDHLFPVGAINDNYTNGELVEKICNLYSPLNVISFLDLGCAGGQLVTDMITQGHLAFGLEGSSNVLNGEGRNNWVNYHNRNLFLCDITKPFYFEDANKRLEFDFIHCSEVIEHLKEEDLKPFFENVKSNLKTGGIFCCQINVTPDIRVVDGKEIIMHHSVFPCEEWKSRFINYGFTPCQGAFNDNHFGYLFGNTKFRDHGMSSIYACLKKV